MYSPPRLSFRAVAVITGAFALPGGVSAETPSGLPPSPTGEYADVTEFTPPETPPAADDEESGAREAEPPEARTSAAEGPSDALTDGPAAIEGPETATDTAEPGRPAPVNLFCLARTICEVKRKIRWGTPAWTPEQCERIGRAVLTASEKYDLSPTLLLGVMINESDLNEKAARVTRRDNAVYAKDSGLMALRCVLDGHDRCINNNLRGLKWSQVMEPATNIALGARELAHWRDDAYVRTTVRVRDRTGRVRPVFKNVPCPHKDHGFWAHYNHGPRYIDRGAPRHYPHHVAVLDHALASVLNIDPPELHQARITVRDPGRPQRTADHPLEARYRRLCSIIGSVRACSPIATRPRRDREVFASDTSLTPAL